MVNLNAGEGNNMLTLSAISSAAIYLIIMGLMLKRERRE